MADEAERIAMKYGLPVAIALLAAGVRLMMTAEKPSGWGIARGLIVGVFVGSLAGLALAETNMSPGAQGAGIGMAAILAEDLVVLLLAVGGHLRDNPGTLLDWLTRRRM